MLNFTHRFYFFIKNSIFANQIELTMNKKLHFLLFIAIFSSQFVFSQVEIITKLPDSTTYWKKENKIGFDISQVAFLNWNAGGVNTVSGLLKGKFTRIYEKETVKWHNELLFKYGINKQDGVKVRKTDDALALNSTLGFRRDTISNWFYSAKFNFSTQFTNGYLYPNTERAISKSFAPAYVFLGAGSEYIDKERKFNLYLSPITMKTTFVLDQRLANEGAFGVTKATYDPITGEITSKGDKIRMELGALFTAYHKDEIFTNMYLENRLALYSDYINNFGNIDVNWQLQLDLVVNKYVNANIGTHIIYDDDIKAKDEVDGIQVTLGPRIQLKQILGIGLTYTF